jgi:hypothetical protein
MLFGTAQEIAQSGGGSDLTNQPSSGPTARSGHTCRRFARASGSSATSTRWARRCDGRTLTNWQDNPFEIAAETFRRIPPIEGVEVRASARITSRSHRLRRRASPGRAAVLAEIGRAVSTGPSAIPSSRWFWRPASHALGGEHDQARPNWRKGRGPHCALHLPPPMPRARRRRGAPVRVVTRRGMLRMRRRSIQLRRTRMDAERLRRSSAARNDARRRRQPEPGSPTSPTGQFTGIPHHRYVLCRVEPEGAA